MKKNKILIYLMIVISIILCIPSIVYLINNGTVNAFDSYYTYNLENSNNSSNGLKDGIIVVGSLLSFSVIYFLIIKKENKIFKNTKQILIFIAIISFIFMMILPYLSSDIYYYIGDSWLAAKYKYNPYYTSVSDLQAKGINDEILNNTGYWKDITSVYGPLWNSVAKLLVSLSFGSVTIALFVFKIASFLVHLFNSFLIYKITRSKKYMLIYGLNPLILIEFLSNVHNDIYLLVFVLLALYFLIRKKSVVFTILFLALSISIKYSTVLLVPFVLIYCFKDNTIPKRILYCILSGISIIGIVVLMYLPYYRDMTIFTNMLAQGQKYSQSIISFLREKAPLKIYFFVERMSIPTFVIGYIMILISTSFRKKILLKDIMKRYNFVMLMFIFIVLTTFQKWYVLWLLSTIIWQNKNMRRFIIYLTISAMIPSIKYFARGTDSYIIGITYSIEMLFFAGIMMFINMLKNKYNYIKIKLIKEKKCHV